MAEEFEDDLGPGGRSATEKAVAQLRERVAELEKLLAASRQEVEDWEDGKLYR